MRGQWETIRCPITKRHYWVFIDKDSSWGYNLSFAETLTRKWVAGQRKEVQDAFAGWHDRSRHCARVIPAEQLKQWQADPNNFTFKEAEEEAARRMKIVADLMAGPYMPHPAQVIVDEGAANRTLQPGEIIDDDIKTGEPESVDIEWELNQFEDDIGDEPMDLSMPVEMSAQSTQRTEPVNRWPLQQVQRREEPVPGCRPREPEATRSQRKQPVVVGNSVQVMIAKTL